MRRQSDWFTPALFGATALVCGVICFWKLSLGSEVPFIIAGFFAVAALGITVGVRRFRHRPRKDAPTDLGPFQ